MNEQVLRIEMIAERIYFVRGEKIVLDFDLAMLYGIETKTLKRAVRRNIKRFPPDFMIELTKEEFAALKYQFGTSNKLILRSQSVTSEKKCRKGVMKCRGQK